MNAHQLELALEWVFEDAAETPERADLNALWQQFEAILGELSVQEQLRLGSQVIDALANLYQAKAELLLTDWENTYDPQDPAFTGDWLQGLVRQSQQVELDALTAPVQRRPRKPKTSPPSENQTLVGEVPKAKVLQMLDQVELEAQKATALAVAHEERIQDWVAAIEAWFHEHPQPIPLLQLRQHLDWPLVQLWLSLLLGGFWLEAIDANFYSAAILVSHRSPQSDPERQAQDYP